MVDLPPLYDFILDADVYYKLSRGSKAQISTLSSLPKKSRETGAKAVEKALTADENIQKILDEAKKLGDSVVKTNEFFEQVKLRLVEVDGQAFRVGGEPLPAFAPTWAGYQEKWTTIFSQSRKTASETAAYIGDFLKSVLPTVKNAHTDDEVKTAQKELESFAKKKDPSGGRTGSHSDEFTELRAALEEFRDKFNGHTNPVREAVEVGEIVALSARIKECDLWVRIIGLTPPTNAADTPAIEVTSTAIALGITASETGPVAESIAIAFGPVSPVVFSTVLATGATAAAAELGFLRVRLEEPRDLQNDYAKLQGKVDDLTGKKRAVERVQADLIGRKGTVVDVARRIDHLALIWRVVASTAAQLGADLKLAHEGGQDAEEFLGRLKYLETNLKTLEAALFIYGTKAAALAT